VPGKPYYYLQPGNQGRGESGVLVFICVCIAYHKNCGMRSLRARSILK
jgi:hypothetical protein